MLAEMNPPKRQSHIGKPVDPTA